MTAADSGYVPPVLSLGEILIDLIAVEWVDGLASVERFDARPGGAPANVAIALARLGVRSAFAGVVGCDPFGDRLRATLIEEKVDASRLRATTDADTSLAFAWKDERGDGHFRLLRLADRLLSAEDVAAAGIERTAAVVVGSVALALEPSRTAVTAAVEMAVKANVPVCFDINIRPTLWSSVADAVRVCERIATCATLLKLSLDDARFLFGAQTAEDAISAAKRLTSGTVVLTDGARGSWYTPEGAARAIHVPAFDVVALEPTGAGDAFTAALISRLLARGWTMPTDDDVRYAAAAGALATTRAGGLDGLPTAAELAAFLDKRVFTRGIPQ